MVKKNGYCYFIEEKWESYSNNILSKETFEILKSNGNLIDIKCNSKGIYCSFKFTFVGVITFKDEIIVVLPKYFDSLFISELDCIKQIMKILKKIPLTVIKNNINDFFISNNDKFSEISICDFIIKDYIKNGIYIKKSSVSRLNINSDNLYWRKTINELQPILSHGNPIYHDCYYNHQKNNIDTYITQIHIAVLEYSISKYAELFDYKLPKINYSKAKKSLLYLGNPNKTIKELNKQLQETFNDRDILLLKTLITFFEKNQANIENSLSLYGTTRYNLVWEYVCADVFGNEYERLKHNIADIVWKKINGNPVINSSNTLEPDILKVVSQNLLILDAKYYSIKLSDNSIKGNPGSYDIVKQLTYALAFKNKGYSEIINCLLYPKEGKEKLIEIFGSVNLKFFEQKPIVNVYISPSLIYERYLNRNTLKEEELINFAEELIRFTEN